MKKISIYTKTGKQAATAYYRIYQFIYQIKGIYKFRKMIPDKVYNKIMPISSKNLVVKGAIFIYIYIRVLCQLLNDYFNKPDILIISRRFINLVFPLSYKYLLENLKKRGTIIIWDFDDNIIESREIPLSGFEYMAKIADKIIVASPVLKKMIPVEHQNKVLLLTTTDGDMYRYVTSNIEVSRLSTIPNELRLIWVGTSVSLRFLKIIIPGLDLYANSLSTGKRLILTVVCNMPLEVESTEKLVIRNIQWERSVAIEELLRSHIGLMPLEDNVLTRGKGGFKLIQYLSVGLPVIGSPVGINSSIISKDVGEQVNVEDMEGWKNAINVIGSSPDIWLNYSHRAYSKWLKYYDFDNHLKIWSQLLT